MKNTSTFLFIVMIIFMFNSCSKNEAEEPEITSQLKQGLINNDHTLLNTEIDLLTKDFYTFSFNSTNQDSIQSYYLDSLIDKINEQPGIYAKLIYYNWKETFYSNYSDILISVDSLGTRVKRIVEVTQHAEKIKFNNIYFYPDNINIDYINPCCLPCFLNNLSDTTNSSFLGPDEVSLSVNNFNPTNDSVSIKTEEKFLCGMVNHKTIIDEDQVSIYVENISLDESTCGFSCEYIGYSITSTKIFGEKLDVFLYVKYMNSSDYILHRQLTIKHVKEE